MLKCESVGIAAVCGLLMACAVVPDATPEAAWPELVEYYAPEDLLMLPSFGAEASPAVIFDLESKLAYFDHVHAEVEPCAPDEPYFCLRGVITMRFAVPKQYSGEAMWEFEGYTYRVLPVHSDLTIFDFDEPTLQFYVDVAVPLIDKRAFRRYVFIWSERSGLIGWASDVHGCSISTAELMTLPAHDYRLACLDQSFVVARGQEGLFASH